MGAQSAFNVTLGAVGVAAGKLAGTISESNDASKNELMAQKAKMNALKMQKLKLQNRKYRLQNKLLEKKLGGSK